MKNTKKFFVVVTSVLLVFAMIGCDQGTKVEYRDRVVGGNGGNNGSGNTPEQDFVLAVHASSFANPAQVPSVGLTLTAPLTVGHGQHIVVGTPTAPPNLSINSVGDGPLFAASNVPGAFNIAAQLTVASGGKLTVYSNSAVNVLKPTGGAAYEERLTVKGGGIVDVKGANGLHIEPFAEAHFETGAILAVANTPSVVVVEESNATYGLLTIESGLKLVIPNVGDEGVNVFTPTEEGAESDDPIFKFPEDSGALAIDSTDLEVYTTTESTATVEAVVDAIEKGTATDEKAPTVADSVKEEANELPTAFTRTTNAGTYVITALSGNKVTLKAVAADGTVGTEELPQYTVLDSGILNIFNAVYEPNNKSSPADTFVAIEQSTSKHTVTYTDAISKEVLGLFYITIGKTAADDLIEVKGTLTETLLTTATATNILVIDIGLPGTTADNSGLPTFRIPTGALGATYDAEENAASSSFGRVLFDAGGTSAEPSFGGTYGGVRLRVNNGAYLHIEANNSAYVAGGANNPSDAGNFNGGCVEVMAGGSLRDGAYEGFPLGNPATILNRLGSRLAVGPEPGSADATAPARAEGYNTYYSGWLIGNAADSPKIAWDGGQANGYIEVRPGQLVLSAKVTVKKLVGLIYDVWFWDTENPSGTKVTNAGLTIDIPSSEATAGYPAALMAGGADFRIYGQQDHTIIVKQGHIQKSFLDSTTTSDFIPAVPVSTPPSPSYPITITNKGEGSGGTTASAVIATYFDPVSGYLNWAVAENEAAAEEPAPGGEE